MDCTYRGKIEEALKIAAHGVDPTSWRLPAHDHTHDEIICHIYTCRSCDPNQILMRYLSVFQKNTFNHGLVVRQNDELFNKYCANFDISLEVQEAFARYSCDDREFLRCAKDRSIEWSIGWMKIALERWENCGGWDALNALDFVFENLYRFDKSDLKQEAIIFLLNYHRKNDRLPSDPELENLMAMVDVMGV